MKRFLIIGGGAAGMLASVYAARNGMEVHLFEQNEKLGKKLFITGKGNTQRRSFFCSKRMLQYVHITCCS